MKITAPNRLWIGLTLTAFLWVIFYAVRISEGRFGTGSEAAFIAAIWGGAGAYVWFNRK